MTAPWRSRSAAVIAMGVLVSGCTGESDQVAVPTTEAPGSPESAAASTAAATIETNPSTTIK